MTRIAVVSIGKMGEAIARRLVMGGAEVMTSFEGRSEATRARAEAGGITGASEAEIAGADIFLSIVPPSTARAMAERYLPLFAAQAHPPVYVDCNAIAPDTSREIGALFAAEGLPFADGGIIGGPKWEGPGLPRLYVSGTGPELAETLAGHGLDCRHLSDMPGEASELKMSYAGLTKGFQALGATMALAADRPALRERLLAELEGSQPMLYGWLSRMLPGMYAKAYRWEGEMEEIAAFLASRGLDPRFFEAAAALYGQIATDEEKVAAIDRFVTRR
ncbi:NAD(P)-dependent oxidoreductase [Pseudooceanicola nanhaiensis]|uniref:NAD(P)-dependent oxidoreductase n=1 Tax=Pseudooceanicola nanhaiensis TaxID=375761 RepID=UPI001CD23D4E|nr:NAD(P)-dependent oxidoreductase [Pseudooceanicola nanhaiensis]MCA0920347.1 DUF1932 domain-containing protein [Pseudooceanicola nanhaiensis]